MFKSIFHLIFTLFILFVFNTVSVAQIAEGEASSFFFDHKPKSVDKIKIEGLLIAPFDPMTVKIRTHSNSLQIIDKATGRDLYLPYSLIQYLRYEPKINIKNSKGHIIISILKYSD